MSRRKNRLRLAVATYALPDEAVTERMQHRSSGAAGVHADQDARRHRAGGRTNRIGSRGAAKRAAITDFD